MRGCVTKSQTARVTTPVKPTATGAVAPKDYMAALAAFAAWLRLFPGEVSTEYLS